MPVPWILWNTMSRFIGDLVLQKQQQPTDIHNWKTGEAWPRFWFIYLNTQNWAKTHGKKKQDKSHEILIFFPEFFVFNATRTCDEIAACLG